MKKFLMHLALFLIPLPVYLSIVFLVDPFNYYGISRFIDEEVKRATSEKVHPQLWKLLEYKHLKSPGIILGDSRSDLIQSEHIREISGDDLYNFSYSGGTLLDMIETFWYAESLNGLKEVYIGINFNLYNDFEKNDHVTQARTISKNFFSYAFSKVVFTTSIQNIKKQFIDKDMKIGEPDMSFDEFWKYHLDINGRRFYQKYKYPETLALELRKVSGYCREHEIKLVFFIPPNHAEWQQRKIDFGLAKEHAVFLNDLDELGTVYNFDTINEFTLDKKNFRDPVHPVNDSLIVHSIWGKQETLPLQPEKTIR